MPIKIISRGIASQEKKYRQECGNCNSKLEYKVEDIAFIPEQYKGEGTNFITCPVCEHNLYNPKKKEYEVSL